MRLSNGVLSSRKEKRGRERETTKLNVACDGRQPWETTVYSLFPLPPFLPKVWIAGWDRPVRPTNLSQLRARPLLLHSFLFKSHEEAISARTINLLTQHMHRLLLY